MRKIYMLLILICGVMGIIFIFWAYTSYISPPLTGFIITDQSEHVKVSRWTHSNLTYAFANEGSCLLKQSSKTRRAFQKIEDNVDSIISFTEINYGEADIVINCIENRTHEQSVCSNPRGEARTVTDNNQIISAEIYIYKSTNLDRQGSDCDDDFTLSLHEILHTFGFEDTDNADSIMYQGWRGCVKNSIIDEEIIDKLKEVYG